MVARWQVQSIGHSEMANLVSLPDALVTVVACEGALQSLPANELGVSRPATELQGHIVDVDELKARGANDTAEEATSVLWQCH